MSAEDPETAADPAPVLPKGAHEVFLGIGGIAFIVLVLCLVGYKVFGAQLTAGLDQACAEAYFVAGQKYEAGGNLAQAVLKYRQALDGQFKNDELRYMCGRAVGDLLFRQDRFEEAIEAYRSLPDAAFGSSGAYTGFVTALWRAGDLTRAKHLGEIWLEKAEAESDATQQLWARNVLMQVTYTEKDFGAALEYGRRILEQAPGNDAAITVARVLRDQGQYAEARACVETMLQNTESPALRRAGRQLLERVAAEGARAGSS